MPVQPHGCSLSEAEFSNVASAYARAVTLHTATARFDGDRATVDLCGRKEPIKAFLDEMIDREAGCCAHFHFEVEETGDGFRIELSVPDAPGIASVALRQAIPTFFPTATILSTEMPDVVPTISRDEIMAILGRGDRLVLVEALPAMYYRKAHLPGAINLPLESFDTDVTRLLPDRDVPIVVYCANLPCRNSSIVAARLIDLGYTDVRDYAEGKQDWIEAGLPTETGRGNAMGFQQIALAN